MRTIRRLILLVAWLALLIAAVLLLVESALGVSSTPGRADCREVMGTIANTTLRRPGGSGTECFATYLPAKGHLKLDLTVPDPAAAELRLDFFGQSCEESGTPEGYRFVEASASALWIEIWEPGSFAFCVAAQDPGLRLAEYKLRVAFVEVFAHKGGDPTEAEPDPDPTPFKGSGVLGVLCDAGEVDDHGDARSCATPVELGQVLTGELANDWGDDEDYFTFFVAPGLRPTVEIEIKAEDGVVVGELYDRRGYRLAGGGGGDGKNARMVKTLSGPGQYFVRVQGGPDRTTGPYRLSMNVLSWW